MAQFNGYRPSEHLPEHSVFDPEKLGAIPANASGDWTPYAPPQNVQQNVGIEQEACTSYGTLDALEALSKFLYNDTSVWSKRYLAWASNTTPQGNDPWTVGTALSEKGTVLDAVWPATSDLNTWALMYAAPPSNVQTDALAWIAQYALTKEWVQPNPTDMMAALEFSPLGVAGFSWAQGPDGLYYTPPNTLPCHYFCVLRAVPNQYWLIFDSYAQDIKKLAWDYEFSDVIKYTLTRNVVATPVAENAWAQFVYWLQQALGLQVGRSFEGVARSPLWERAKIEFAKYVPKMCPMDGLKRVQLHHSKWPFHTNAAEELNPTQFRWACEGLGTHQHHILEGHNGNFQSINLSFDERVEQYQHRPLWNGSAWEPTNAYPIKYKLTEADLQAWNKTFGTSWEYT